MGGFSESTLRLTMKFDLHYYWQQKTAEISVCLNSKYNPWMTTFKFFTKHYRSKK